MKIKKHELIKIKTYLSWIALLSRHGMKTFIVVHAIILSTFFHLSWEMYSFGCVYFLAN